MCVHWAGRGLRPLDPRTELRRRCAGLSPARRCGRRRAACRQDHERRSIPDVRQRTVSHGRQTASRFLRSASAFGDRRGRPCGNTLEGQPEGWPSFKTNMRRSVVAENRSRDCIGRHRPHAEQAAVEQHTGHSRRDTAAGAEAQETTERTSRITATRSARWRRKAARRGGSRSRCRVRGSEIYPVA